MSDLRPRQCASKHLAFCVSACGIDETPVDATIVAVTLDTCVPTVAAWMCGSGLDLRAHLPRRSSDYDTIAAGRRSNSRPRPGCTEPLWACSRLGIAESPSV